jgi:hypothetical protein
VAAWMECVRIIVRWPSAQPGLARASQMGSVTVLSIRDKEPRNTCVNRAILTVLSYEPDLERVSRLRYPPGPDGAGAATVD